MAHETPFNPLPEEEAHQLANEMRVAAGVSAHGNVEGEGAGRIRTQEVGLDLGRESTPEDYDRALEAVEEIKRLAAEESGTGKVLNMLGRLSERTRYCVVRAIYSQPLGQFGARRSTQRIYEEIRRRRK